MCAKRAIVAPLTDTFSAGAGIRPSGFDGGNAAAAELEIGGQSSPDHLVVQGDDSINDVIGRSFQDRYQYAFFSNHDPRLEVAFNEAQVYDEAYLKQGIENLPPFDDQASREAKEKAAEQYRNYFHTTGTHVIVLVTYGARLTMVGCMPSDRNCDIQTDQIRWLGLQERMRRLSKTLMKT